MTENHPHPPVDGERKIPEGSYAAGRIVRLPQGAERPISVFVNGVEQNEGEDFEIDGENIVFTRDGRLDLASDLPVVGPNGEQ